jgi:hypothetical protein
MTKKAKNRRLTGATIPTDGSKLYAHMCAVRLAKQVVQEIGPQPNSTPLKKKRRRTGT